MSKKSLFNPFISSSRFITGQAFSVIEWVNEKVGVGVGVLTDLGVSPCQFNLAPIWDADWSASVWEGAGALLWGWGAGHRHKRPGNMFKSKRFLRCPEPKAKSLWGVSNWIGWPRLPISCSQSNCVTFLFSTQKVGTAWAVQGRFRFHPVASGMFDLSSENFRR